MESGAAFYQQFFFKKTGITLLEDGFQYYRKGLKGEIKLFQPYGDVLKPVYYHYLKNRLPVALGIGAFISFGIILLQRSITHNVEVANINPLTSIVLYSLAALSFLIGLGVYLYVPIELYGIPIEEEGSIKYIYLLNNRPNKEQFEFAIDQLYAHRRAFFRRNFLTIFSQNPKDAEIRRFAALLRENIISKDEHDTMIEILLEDSEDFDDRD